MADILVTRRFFDQALESLKGEGHHVEINDTSRILSKTELMERLSGKNGLICLLNDKIDSEVMGASPNLEIIANVAVGYDNIDLDAATERGIMVSNTPGVLTNTTADLAFGLLMSSARMIPAADTYSREGRYDGWELMQPHMGVDVYGKTLGIVGMGRIGRAVAERAHHGFNMEILYYDRSENKQAEYELNAERVDFGELLSRCDFITVHTPLTKETKHLFSSQEFSRMKEEAILINTARGEIVDEDSLADALKAGEIRGAALDVFEQEPQVHPELKKLTGRVVLTPHIGSASIDTRLEMARMAAENMNAGLAGEQPPNLVNKDVY